MEALNKISEIRDSFLKEIEDCTSIDFTKDIHVKYLGRKSGEIQKLFKYMGIVTPEEKGALGKALNEIKVFVSNRIDVKTQEIEDGHINKEFIDVTLPGRKVYTGRKHPLSMIMDEMIAVFEGMGFEIANGPEMETDYYNFEALNIPEDHPAKALQDTFYLDDGRVLRTHTSPVQIRTMQNQKPPIRIIAPGRVYRKDTPDATHTPVFHQMEGLYVDKNVTLAELKGTLLGFARALFGDHMQIRFRSGYFPFTEPSIEYDFTCVACDGKGCSVCKNTGWIEISGAGMIDPAVYGYVGLDPEVYTGYAWGMGVERIAMLKYKVNDIRLFYDNDQRFLNQFY